MQLKFLKKQHNLAFQKSVDRLLNADKMNDKAKSYNTRKLINPMVVLILFEKSSNH